MKATLTIVILSLVWLSVYTPPVSSQETALYTTISVGRERVDLEDALVIRGTVVDFYRTAIGNVAISLQIINPHNSSVHVALLYSRHDGTYSDYFKLPAEAPQGNYTIYVTAGKPGYVDANFQMVFSFLNPDFAMSASASTILVEQGQTAICTIALMPSNVFNEPISLNMLGLPKGSNVSFDRNPVKPPASVTLTLNISFSTPVGSYNVTVIGSGGGNVHSTPIILTVAPKGQALYLIASTITIVSVLATSAIFVVSRVRKAMQEKVPLLMRRGARPGLDREYLATARALAELERDRATGKIDERTYQQLKRQLEKRSGRRDLGKR